MHNMIGSFQNVDNEIEYNWVTPAHSILHRSILVSGNCNPLQENFPKNSIRQSVISDFGTDFRSIFFSKILEIAESQNKG